MRPIQIGLAGLGTVGTGVAEILAKQPQVMLKKVLVRDLAKPRDIVLQPEQITTEWKDLILDPDIQIVVETIGGVELSRQIVLEALKQGKHVVTANKALLAECWEEIQNTLKQSSGKIRFEAAVAGGIPIVKAISEGLAGNEIQSLMGIINGTANYILTEMEEREQDLAPILKEAQDMGYAEADPTFDIDGIDAAHKLSILTALAYGICPKLDQIHVEGIRNITLQDIQNASEMGYTIKLLAIARIEEEALDVRVHPTLIPEEHVLAAISGVFNGVAVNGNYVGETLFYGQGAGRYPTASAVVGDVLDLVHQRFMSMPLAPNGLKLMSFDEVQTRFYLRLTVTDQPGVLANIARILGEHGIGIASVIQKEDEDHRGIPERKGVPLIIMTHYARQKDMQKSLTLIEQLEAVLDRVTMIRAESHT